MTGVLTGLTLADAPERWSELGFDVDKSTLWIDGITLRLGAPGRGIVGWTLWASTAPGDIDGLSTSFAAEPPPPVASMHPTADCCLITSS